MTESTENPLRIRSPEVMPTDADIEGLFTNTETTDREDGRPRERGVGIDWNEFHMPAEFRQ